MAEDNTRLLPFIRKEILYGLIVVFGMWAAIYDFKTFRTVLIMSLNAVFPVEISRPPNSVSPHVEPSPTTGYGTEVGPSGKSAGVGPSTSGSGETRAMIPKPERDWVELTDKVVDWIVKLVGCAVAVYGALGLYNKNQSGIKQ